MSFQLKCDFNSKSQTISAILNFCFRYFASTRQQSVGRSGCGDD